MHRVLQPFLAQPSGLAGVLGWSLVLILLVVGATAGVLRLRRWLKEEDASTPIGFTLSDLRQLHKAGKMTDEEYKRAKAQMVAVAKATAGKLPDPLAPRPRDSGRGDNASSQ